MFGIVCNPVAGAGLSLKVLDRITSILDTRNIAYTVRKTEKKGHAFALTADLVSAGCSSILSIGGDGTVSEVASALAGSGVPLGIIPAGTGNDFIKAFGLPRDPEHALEFILNHDPSPADMGRINDFMFINEIGTGFDVKVLDYAEKAKKHVHGLLPYLYGVICTIIHYKPVLLTYQIDDGSPVTENILVCAVANGSIIGGGIPIAPSSDPKDGIFDIVIIKDVPKIKLPFYLGKLMTGNIYKIPGTTHLKAHKFTFSAPEMRVNVDGEIVPFAKVTAQICEGALLLYC